MERRAENNEEFEEAIHEYTYSARHQFNYEAILETFLEFNRFRYWTTIADRYVDLNHAKFLSSGCGMGGSLLAYWERGISEGHGIEVDDSYVRLGRIRIKDYEGLHIHKLGSPEFKGFDDNYFDVIESIEVIEHVEDADEYMGELYRMVRPGGVVILTTPNRLYPFEQHLDIFGPPLFTVPVADSLFGLLSKIPFFSEERRFKYEKLKGIRTQNMSLFRLTRLAKKHGFRLEFMTPREKEETYPIPSPTPLQARLLHNRFTKYFVPIKGLAVILFKE